MVVNVKTVIVWHNSILPKKDHLNVGRESFSDIWDLEVGKGLPTYLAE